MIPQLKKKKKKKVLAPTGSLVGKADKKAVHSNEWCGKPNTPRVICLSPQECDLAVWF